MTIHQKVYFWQLFLVEGLQAIETNPVFNIVVVPDKNSIESFLLNYIYCHQQKQVKIPSTKEMLNINLKFGIDKYFSSSVSKCMRDSS